MGVYSPVDVYPSYFDDWDGTLMVNKNQDIYVDTENDRFIIEISLYNPLIEESIIITNQGEIIYEL